MKIESSAPTRIDLAGGTIDIPPIFLFHEGASTVNFGLSIRAGCCIETRDDDRIILRSVDQSDTVETTVADIASLKNEPRLELLSKLVYFFRPTRGFELVTESKAPAGAGLAGSSTLNIACIAALNELTGSRYNEDRFIPIAAAVECQVIRVPTGYQDYFSAQYGGVASIKFGPDGMHREAIATDENELTSRIALCYTGEPRNSGINNWEITKRHIDGDAELFDLFDGIRDIAIGVREALENNDWERLGKLMVAEFELRKRLSPNITTPQMDAIIETAINNGAIAAKVCGAGGGGCIAFFCNAGTRSAVETAIATIEGVRVLDFTISPTGLELTTSD